MAQTVKSGAPPCGLYLILPQNCMEPEFLKNLRELSRSFNLSAYEKNGHVIEYRPDPEGTTPARLEHLKAFAQLCTSQGIIFVVTDDADLAKNCNADGVILKDVRDVEGVRRALGDDAIIGVRCGMSRLTAQKAIDFGADYVSFGEVSGEPINPSIVQWWRMKTENPCMVEGNITDEDCGIYATAGADFIDATSYVLNHPKGVGDGVLGMLDAIDAALENNNKKEAV